jgi:hypothetical protein
MIDRPDRELITVLETRDQVLLPMAKQTLDKDGIEYQVRREHLQHLFGLARSVPDTAVAGLAQLIVRSEDASNARQLLKDCDLSA